MAILGPAGCTIARGQLVKKMELTPCHTGLEVCRQLIVQYNILGCFINTESDFGAWKYAQTLQPVTWSVYCPI